ncbi:hypothetical protein ACFL0O_04785 [Thermodesulfobacteriota bacterium]
MHKLVFFSKSYKKDMYRARRMAESFQRFNTDNIPLYLSVPAKEIDDFKNCFKGISCDYFADEDILNLSNQVNGTLPELYPPHLIQQLIKLEFWRTGLCENYAWIDSDSYFIKPFKVSDFFYDEETPYIVQDEFIAHEEMKRMKHVPYKIRKKRIYNIDTLIKKFRGLFNNTGAFLAFGGSTPIIWSCRVLKSFNEDYLKSRNKNIYEILYEYPCETQLYGEYLHHSKVIPIMPISHMFKSFYYADDFFLSQEMGESEYSLSKNYFGICVQSNWARIKETKTTKDRIKKRFDEFRRAIGLLKFER